MDEFQPVEAGFLSAMSSFGCTHASTALAALALATVNITSTVARAKGAIEIMSEENEATPSADLPEASPVQPTEALEETSAEGQQEASATEATEPVSIRLDQFLQLCGVPTGGQAKLLIQGGEVTVNGEVETRRRKKLVPGDSVGCDGQLFDVGFEEE